MHSLVLGEINLVPVAIALIASVSLYTDAIYRKIYNPVTATGMLLGLAFAVYSLGLAGLGSSVLGMGVAVLLFGWLFAFRVLGAGDVKLLMAFGALGGVKYCVETAVLSLLIAAAFGVIQLAWLGKLGAFLVKLRRFLLSVFVKEFELDLPKADASVQFPFGVALAIASVWLIFDEPFKRLGLELWI